MSAPEFQEQPAQPRAAGSAAWSFAGNLATKGLGLARTVVAAHMLGPSEFGKFALVAAALGILDVATMPGLYDAIVRRDADQNALRSAWTTMVVRGAILSVAIFVMAPTLASLLGDKDAASLLRWMALIPLLRSSLSLAPILAWRRVDSRPWTVVQVVTQAVESLVVVGYLMWEPNALGLAIGAAAGQVGGLLASFAVAGFSPRLRFRLREARHLFAFAGWRFGSNLLTYTSTRVDDILVGRFAGLTALGNYRLAYRLANLPATELTSPLSDVAFAYLSREYRRSVEDARASFLRYLRIVSGIALPASAFLAIFASWLIDDFFGTPWRAAVVPIQIMTVAGFVRAMLATGGSFFIAADRPHLDTVMQSLRAVSLLVALAFLLRYDAAGAAVASLVSILVVLPIWIAGLRSMGVEARSVTWAVAASVPHTAVVAAVAALAAPLLAGLGARTLLIAVLYLVVALATAPLVNRRLVDEIGSLLPGAIRDRLPGRLRGSPDPEPDTT